AVIPSEEGVTERVECGGGDTRANVVDEADDESLVVDGCQRLRDHLVGLERMVQVRTRVVRARVAVAGLIDGGEVAPTAGRDDAETAVTMEYAAAAGDARGRDAVERVGAVLDRREQVVGLADAQEVTGLVLGQFLGDPRDDRPELRLLQRTADT